MVIKIIIFYLLTFSVIFVSAACNSAETADEQTAQTTVADETEAADNLPDRDFNDADVNILIRSEFAYEFNTEDTSELVNDALYKRDLKIEERFGVKLNYIPVNGNWGNRELFKNAVSQSVTGGTGDFDVVCGAENQLFSYAPEGLFVNLYHVEYIGLAEKCWAQKFVTNASYKNLLFFVTGDAALTTLDNMCVVYFNKNMINDFNLNSPYDLVKNSRWTHENMAAMAADVSSELNGDGKFGTEDQYGWITSPLMTGGFLSAYQTPVTEFDTEGIPRIILFDEKMTDRFIALGDFLFKNNSAFITENAATEVTTKQLTDLFTSGNSLFMTQTLGQAKALRTFENDFGIIPYPKFDEQQSEYYTHVLETNSVFGIPSFVKDIEKSGIILQALGLESYNSVTPVYFDVALTTKYTRDNDSEEMLVIIRDGMYFNFGHVHTIAISPNGLTSEIMGTFATKKSGSDMVSYYEGRRSQDESALSSLIDAYEKYITENP